jgi:hypothetical protein
VLSVWQHCLSASATIGQLDTAAQQAVVSALVTQQREAEALSLVQQTPELLPHLASLWQQPEGGTASDALLLQALQLCVETRSKAAAAAADKLTGLLLQQGPPAELQHGELCAQLVQLLCNHGSVTAVLQLLTVCLSSSTGTASAGLAAAVANAAVAAVTDGNQQQQKDMLQLLAGNSKQVVVQSALAKALAKPSAAAVGLLLNALQRCSPAQRLGQLLTSEQLGQLCSLVCDSTNSTNSGSLSALPGVYKFARECLAEKELPASAAAQLVGALCKQHPELQPSVAAAHLGMVAVHSEQGHTAGMSTDVADPAAFRQLVQTVASLCYSQVPSAEQVPSSAADFDALEASLAEWVAALPPDAAAASLFAASWHRAQQPGAAVPLLCVELYQRAKSTGDSLVFDLGLAAAAEAAGYTGNWHRGTARLLFSQVLLRDLGKHPYGSRLDLPQTV